MTNVKGEGLPPNFSLTKFVTNVKDEELAPNFCLILLSCLTQLLDQSFFHTQLKVSLFYLSNPEKKDAFLSSIKVDNYSKL